LVANGKHRKTRIFELEEGSQIIKGENELKSYIIDYYKGFFGPSQSEYFALDENRIHDIPQITSEENEKLTACKSVLQNKK
jgi:hypothetical protein